MVLPASECDKETRAGPAAGLADRWKLWLVSTAGYWAMRIIGSTLRWRVEGWEHYQALLDAKKRIIYTFWHGRLFAGTYFFRNRGIVVMTSQAKDGEYIARVIRRFGYGAARGSSTRGGRRALVQMIRELRRGNDIGFSIDGPRGPRYIAKPGATWIAAKTGAPLFPFCFAAEKKWVLKSWDHFQIPKPFSRVLVLLGEGIHVRPAATEQEIEEAQLQLQRALVDLQERSDGYWRR